MNFLLKSPIRPCEKVGAINIENKVIQIKDLDKKMTSTFVTPTKIRIIFFRHILFLCG